MSHCQHAKEEFLEALRIILRDGPNNHDVGICFNTTDLMPMVADNGYIFVEMYARHWPKCKLYGPAGWRTLSDPIPDVTNYEYEEACRLAKAAGHRWCSKWHGKPGELRREFIQWMLDNPNVIEENNHEAE